MRRWIVIAAVLLSLIVIAGAGYYGYLTSQPEASSIIQPPPTVEVTRGDIVLSVTAPGQVVNTHQVDLSMGVGGPLAEVLVRAGDSVKQGQALARIGGRETFEAAVASAQFQVSQAQAALDALVANAPQVTAQVQLALVEAQKSLDDARHKRDAMNYPRASQSRIDQLESEYQSALQEVALAQKAFDKVSRRKIDDPLRIIALRALTAAQTRRDSALATLNFVKGKPTDQDLAEADARLAQAMAAMQLAQHTWERVKDGPDPEQLESAQYNLSNAKAALAKARSDLAKLELAAPFDGVITDVKAAPGQVVAESAPILTITDPQALEVQATVVEEDYPLVAVGQPVTLYFDALPDANLTGQVARIIPRRMSGSQPNYPIVVSLDNIADHLVEGMSADVSIVIEQRKIVLRLPRAVVRARSDGTAQVEVWTGLRIEKRTVRVGLRGDSFTEILSGLEEGEQVVAR